MKRTIFFLLALVFLLSPSVSAVSGAPACGAESMILIHQETGEVLAERNADAPLPIASTTKLMTALVALERGSLDAEIRIDPAWTGVEGSSLYLRAGESYTLRDLLYGLLLASGNDAAVAIACSVAGSTEAFAALMNGKAAALGMTGTHFANPHGLDDPEHYSCARDMAALMAAAMRNADFRAITAARSYSTHGVTYVNHNKLLWSCPGVNGGKTGYTMAAGRCLVTSCERGGLALVCVTLSDPGDWADHAALYDWACGEYECVRCASGQTLASIPVLSGDREQVSVTPAADVALCVPRGAEVTAALELPRFAFASLRKGLPAGSAVFSVAGETKAGCALVWGENVARVSAAPAPGAGGLLNHFVGIYSL